MSTHPAAVFASGLLFGAVFLSLVASTTALVRHNLAPADWPAGIAAFTIVFAAGQIVGPSAVGLIADHFGGLRAGFACSAAVLALAAIVGDAPEGARRRLSRADRTGGAALECAERQGTLAMAGTPLLPTPRRVLIAFLIAPGAVPALLGDPVRHARLP